MPRYQLTIAYDGTDFCGWQKQEPFQIAHGKSQMTNEPGTMPGMEADRESLESFDPLKPTPPVPKLSNPPPSRKFERQGLIQREGEDRPREQLRTVQHVVERAVREIVHEPIDLKGASRTDSGVHARGQVAAFTCTGDADVHHGWPVERGVDRLIRAINGKLPEDVLVHAAGPVADDFDPVIGATSKAYSYTLHVSRERPLWDRRFVHQIWDELDLARMQEAAGRIIGEQDFVAFAAAGHGRLTTVRTVFTCEVSEQAAVDGARRLRIDISGSGFLYNMVRIIAGTLVECGRGRMTADEVTRAIESKDRRNAGPTLPASGLCLEWIRYAADPDRRKLAP